MTSKFHKPDVATAAPFLMTICEQGEQGKNCQFRNKEMRDGQLITLKEPRPVDECGCLAVSQIIGYDDPLKERLVASECPVEAQYPDIRAAVEAEGVEIDA